MNCPVCGLPVPPPVASDGMHDRCAEKLAKARLDRQGVRAAQLERDVVRGANPLMPTVPRSGKR